MEILKIAIQAEGGVGKLAEALDVRQNVVSNWRTRGLPKSWAQVLLLKYGQEQAKAQAEPAQQAIETVAEAHAAVKTEVKDVDTPVKLQPLASTEVADKLALDERRKGLPTRRLKKQPFTGPDKRVGPSDRRGFKLPEVTAALPKGV